MATLFWNPIVFVGSICLLTKIVYLKRVIDKTEQGGIMYLPDFSPNYAMKNAASDGSILNFLGLSEELESTMPTKERKGYVLHAKSRIRKTISREKLPLGTKKKHLSKYYIMTNLGQNKFIAEDKPTPISPPYKRKRVPRFVDNPINKRRRKLHPDVQYIGTDSLGFDEEDENTKHKQKTQSIFSKAPKFTLPNTSRRLQQELIDHKNPEDLSDEMQIAPHAHKIINPRNREPTDNFPEDVTEENENIDLPPDDLIKPSHRSDFTDDGYVNLSPKNNKPFERQQNLNHETAYKVGESEQSEIRSEKKIITLLNILEEEIKHKQLDSTEKQVINRRIKHIYDEIFSHHPDLKWIQNNPDEHRMKNIRRFDFDGISSKEIVIKKTKNNKYVKTDNHENRDYRKNIKHHLKIHQDRRRLETTTHRFFPSREKDDRPHISAKFKEHVYNTDDTDRNSDSDYDFLVDPLSIERRKYYQYKIDHLKRRLGDFREFHDQIRPKSARRIHRVRSSELESQEYIVPHRRRYLIPY